MKKIRAEIMGIVLFRNKRIQLRGERREQYLKDSKDNERQIKNILINVLFFIIFYFINFIYLH